MIPKFKARDHYTGYVLDVLSIDYQNETLQLEDGEQRRFDEVDSLEAVAERQKIEWFELTEYSTGQRIKTVDEQLNHIEQTHYILDVKYCVASSSDWNVLSGGQTYVLVKAQSREEQVKFGGCLE